MTECNCRLKVGNESDVSWMYLDTVAPIGTVTDTNGVTVANGGYTNKAIKYTATDAGGISYCELKKPYTEEWVKYTPGTSIAEMYGWYTFRAVDKAGNVSEEYKVYYDISAPAGTLYGETTKLSSGSYTNAAYIKYEAIDVYGGIESSYVKMPGSSGYTKYALGTMLETEGTYSFYAVDKCGNKSDTMSVTLDKTKPTGSLYAGNSIIDSGSITNAETISFTPQDEFGIAEVFVKRPEDNEFTEYKQGTSYTEEGTYSFYCVDRAGNVSDCYEVTLDREIPKGQLYVDDEPCDNGSYTNGAYIRFECEETCYVKQPDSEDFTEYVSGTEYYRPGKYIFYGISEAGNSTGEFTIIIDRTVKTLEVKNVIDGKTDGDVFLDWTDGDPEIYAPITNVTINGKPYKKGDTVYTIDTGSYEIVCVDAAGNVWKTEFVSQKQNVVNI